MRSKALPPARAQGHIVPESFTHGGSEQRMRWFKRGMESGEFRKMDVETTIDVVIAPILMLLIWRYSMNCCENSDVHPETYLQIHMDLLRHGLRGTEKETRV